ncbi:MAG TPA: hypothetical protein VHU15_16970 [Stellaceae bacterium]|jgi:drug/metabolite transporter (DMT)-like permease|nr:hypothetical protein [Stellaceae bacterium]
MAQTDERPLWFKARRYGWGWTPASPEGWIVTIVAGVALLAGNYLIAILGGPSGEIRSVDDLMPRLSPSVVLVAVIVWNTLVLIPTIWICWKTGERPRWNWGGRGRRGSTPPDRGASS